MTEETMPGAALEAPDVFRAVAAPLWPRLPLAVGYRGPARWVGLYVSGDKVRFYDGSGGSTSGDTSLFLAYKRHPAVAFHLAGAHLGSADDEASAWLLVDQAERLLYLAPGEEARRFLAAQWPRYDAPLEYTEAELARLLEDRHDLAEMPDWMERLAESVRERRANYALMQQWLSQCTTEEQQGGGCWE